MIWITLYSHPAKFDPNKIIVGEKSLFASFYVHFLLFVGGVPLLGKDKVNQTFRNFTWCS